VLDGEAAVDHFAAFLNLNAQYSEWIETGVLYNNVVDSGIDTPK